MFLSKAGVYRLLKARDRISSSAFIFFSANSPDTPFIHH
jgi:hypothetical protein